MALGRKVVGSEPLKRPKDSVLDFILGYLGSMGLRPEQVPVPRRPDEALLGVAFLWLQMGCCG